MTRVTLTCACNTEKDVETCTSDSIAEIAWYKGGALLAKSATMKNYVIPGKLRANSGDYHCVVKTLRNTEGAPYEAALVKTAEKLNVNFLCR